MNIISFSTGLSSALTVERALRRFGADDCRVVFMDTLIEDGDNYRFMADCASRWREVYGLPEIIRLADGRTPYEVAEDHNSIFNQKMAACTHELKIELFVKWLQSQDFESVVIHIGYDFSEVHRCEATRRNYDAKGWAVDFPLLWKPYEFRDYSQVVREDWSIEPPRMYALGYTHANCGGLCVKQGQGDWLRTLVHFPERYKQIEQWEAKMRSHTTRQNYAIVRDQSANDVKPLPLADLRFRYEDKLSAPLLFALDSKSGCVHCGVGEVAE